MESKIKDLSNLGRMLTDEEVSELHKLPAAVLEKLGDPESSDTASSTGTSHKTKSTKTPEKTTAELRRDRLVAEFDGTLVRRGRRKFSKPSRTIEDEEWAVYRDDREDKEHDGKEPFLTPIGEVYWKDGFVDTFLDARTGQPRRLVVQATEAARGDTSFRSWMYADIKGSVPSALRLANWSTDPSLNKFQSIMRQAVVAVPLQLLLGLPGVKPPWESEFEPAYQGYPGFHWKWPKHAINPLDTREEDRKRYAKPHHLSSRQRLYRPRRLIVFENDKWELNDNPAKDVQYIFISYHWGSFKGSSEHKVSKMAEDICKNAGVRAYFQDVRCNAPREDKDLLTADVNRMSDVIRGSQFVALLLPDDLPQRKLDWGQRLWTLPEGLLAPDKLHVATWMANDKIEIKLMSKVELTSEFWVEEVSEGEEAPGRILAEHYDRFITLSRLELFSAAVSTLNAKITSCNQTGADLAYALMGLLRFRIDPDPTDDLFQVIARLSLANDNDGLIERLISMFPKSIHDSDDFIRSFAEKDRYETHCWDIDPRCRVVGVADEPGSVILNDCRAIPIRWDQFPRLMHKRDHTTKNRIAELVVRSGAWWLAMALILAITYAALFIATAHIVSEINDVIEDIEEVEDEEISSEYQRYLWIAIVIFTSVGLFLSIFAPAAVHSLFGGPLLQTTPYLVGLEGTLPRKDLERRIFGRDTGILRYDPSSTPFGRFFRNRYVRKGREPDWITTSTPHPASPGHRWFTLVDTGNLTISIFEARRPPTVALITGADGGMLRAVLCSWRFIDDCHFRETVIRVPANSWKLCRPAAWIKVCLHSQGDRFALGKRVGTQEAAGGDLGAPSKESESISSAPPVPHKSSGRVG